MTVDTAPWGSLATAERPTPGMAWGPNSITATFGRGYPTEAKVRAAPGVWRFRGCSRSWPTQSRGLSATSTSRRSSEVGSGPAWRWACSRRCWSALTAASHFSGLRACGHASSPVRWGSPSFGCGEAGPEAFIVPMNKVRDRERIVDCLRDRIAPILLDCSTARLLGDGRLRPRRRHVFVDWNKQWKTRVRR